MLTSAERPVSDLGEDDLVLPFAVTPLDIRGRVVRLGPSVDRILKQHGYPDAVSRLVGEAAALTALLGSALKIEGRFQLQTKTDGVVDMLVVDFDAPDRLRAFARFDAERLATVGARQAPAELLGHGHLALTIDQGADMSRYQGVVPLEGQGLEAAAHQYFAQSEQIPTLVRLAVAQNVTGAGTDWRAGGLLAQFLPESEDRRRQVDLDPGDAPEGFVRAAPDDDSWSEAKALAATAEDHELVDPTLSSERLLFRLFHERGVRVFEPQPLRDACRCSQERIAGMLRSFSRTERQDMIGPDGRIGVTCEFCGTHRAFDPADFDPLQ
ncbi:Hsp33 family molecular chaperone [Lichenibacterium ramalinae]|uniref:Hsp33 family molecular chaperone n=1 Tax=Lichenibacterium ramalinae TaxID=2316527 RepID=A0A4V1RHZ9_9HYPH|nr:Hsp33 family molecular chaperone [Lichenibacterium ramalinae]RYB01807.1 Hsp33 family molecular chaperone [Lichenibacterium ramalinae]